MTTDEAFKEKCTKDALYVDYKNITKGKADRRRQRRADTPSHRFFPSVLKPGDLIYVDDGLISLKAEKIEATSVECVAVNSKLMLTTIVFNNHYSSWIFSGGRLGSKKGCNLPNVNVDLPAISEKDHGDLMFGLEQEVDMVFASFIRKGSDIVDIRKVSKASEEG